MAYLRIMTKDLADLSQNEDSIWSVHLIAVDYVQNERSILWIMLISLVKNMCILVFGVYHYALWVYAMNFDERSQSQLIITSRRMQCIVGGRERPSLTGWVL